jgi:hypothetical protein
MNIGFQDPVFYKRAVKKRQPGHYLCTDPVCGCGHDFPYPQNLGRHLAAARERLQKEQNAAEDEVHRPEVTRPTPPEDVRRIRTAVRTFRKGAEAMTEAADVLERVVVENAELKRKLGKMEDIFGKALDTL